MRKFISMLLLAIFGLPAVVPLLSLQANTESRLPACCRKAGQHHCEMSSAERALVEGLPKTYRALLGMQERCPYAPSTVPSERAQALLLTTARVLYAGLVQHPSAVAQTECLRRIARDRNRQKRGPPVVSFS